tara:strand:- start:6022 stop:6924 length:903 start_codon:yes stop_codon:yes gene_type:complete
MEAAEKLKLTAENLNSMLSTSLKKISDTRKRTKKLKAVSILRRRRKKKEIKLEIPSEFKKSTSRINKVLPRGMGQGMMTSFVELIGLLLVGVAINNIEELNAKIQELRAGFEKNMKFLKGIVENVYNGTRGFIALFDSEDREQEYKNNLKKTDELKDLKKEQDDIDFSKINEKLKKEYTTVQNRFDMNQDDIEAAFQLRKSGMLSTGEKFEVVKREGKDQIKVIDKNGEVQVYSYDEFKENFKEELPNIIELKSNSNAEKLFNNLEISSTKSDAELLALLNSLPENERERIKYVFTEVKT